MIRNVVVGRLRDDAVLAALDAALGGLQLPGLVAMRVGRDLGLRDGGWSSAITDDGVDEDAYRGDDLDEEHDRVRRELFTPIAEQIVRVQFALPG